MEHDTGTLEGTRDGEMHPSTEEGTEPADAVGDTPVRAFARRIRSVLD